MASPDRNFSTAAIFTHSTGLTPNSGDAALYIKSDNKAYVKDSTGTETAVGAGPTGSTGSTDNAIIRADGTGGSSIQSSAVVIDDATTSTQANVAITNQHSGETNSAFVITPKGTGAFVLGPKPDGAVTGGNSRGDNSVDLTTWRTAAAQVASGLAAVNIGYSATSSGTASTCVGPSGVASGQGSCVFGGVAGNGNVASTTGASAIGGGGNVAQSSNYTSVFGGISNLSSGAQSVIVGGDSNISTTANSAILGGKSSVADRFAMHAHSAGQFAAAGDAQRTRFVLRNKTTTNSAVELFLDGSSARLSVPSGKFLTGTINIAGIKSDGTAAASYIRQFSIKNVAATTTLVGTVNTIGTDEAASTSISITADDTNDSLKVEVTGIASETWRWVAAVDVVEVAYGS